MYDGRRRRKNKKPHCGLQSCNIVEEKTLWLIANHESKSKNRRLASYGIHWQNYSHSLSKSYLRAKHPAQKCHSKLDWLVNSADVFFCFCCRFSSLAGFCLHFEWDRWIPFKISIHAPIHFVPEIPPHFSCLSHFNGFSFVDPCHISSDVPFPQKKNVANHVIPGKMSQVPFYGSVFIFMRKKVASGREKKKSNRHHVSDANSFRKKSTGEPRKDVSFNFFFSRPLIPLFIPICLYKADNEWNESRCDAENAYHLGRETLAERITTRNAISPHIPSWLFGGHVICFRNLLLSSSRINERLSLLL